MWKWIVKKIIRPKWVAFSTKDAPEEIELGLQIFGVIVGLYKADTILYTNPATIRKPLKREFGESLRP